MTRRRFLLGIAGAAGCTQARPRLNVYNWSNYAGPDTIANFEAEFGVRVRYATFESNEEMLAKVISGNSGWDVVFPSNYLIRPMLENRLLAPLQHHWLGNLNHLDARFRSPQWDPNLEWSTPYMWGASGIAYNPQLRPEPRTWSDLWEPRLAGRMTMLDDPAEVLGACLKKLGYSVNSTNRSELEQARREAIAQKKLLRAYLNAEVRDQLVAGDVLAAQLWNTTTEQAAESGRPLGFAFPAEGFALYADNAVILRESHRQELAHRFLDYLLRPPVAAAVVAHTRTATANASALALTPDAIRRSPTLFPDQTTLSRGEWFQPLPSAAQALRDRLWTEIKSS